MRGQAAERSIDLEVAAEPASCRRTAAELGALREAGGQASALMVRHVAAAEDAFGGLSGIVYRESSRSLGVACERFSARCGRLAAGLLALAADLDVVLRLMGEARAVATPDLVVTGWRVWSPTRPAGTGDAGLDRAWEAWGRAVSLWLRARDLEEAAGRRWLEVLGPAVPHLIDPDGPVQPIPVGYAAPHPAGGGHIPGPVADLPGGAVR